MDNAIPSIFDFKDELPFSKADYEAVKQIAIRNGGTISNEEIFSVIMRGYTKLANIKKQLEEEGIILKNPRPQRDRSTEDDGNAEEDDM